MGAARVPPLVASLSWDSHIQLDLGSPATWGGEAGLRFGAGAGEEFTHNVGLENDDDDDPPTA